MKEYRLKFFANAKGPEREKSRFTYLNFIGQKIDVPYLIWFIEGADKNILIDAGCTAQDYTGIIKEEKKRKGLIPSETYRDVEDVIPFDDGFKKYFGINPNDVDIIILTHLHSDHCMGVNRCKNAKVIVQEEEWKGIYAHHPLWDAAYAPRWFYEEMKNVELIQGDVELFPGIRAIFTPGHSYGGQSIAVNTEKGEYVVSGFCTVKENFYPPEAYKKTTGHSVMASGVHIDATICHDSALRLVNACGDKVLACHEPALFDINSIP